MTGALKLAGTKIAFTDLSVPSLSFHPVASRSVTAVFSGEPLEPNDSVLPFLGFLRVVQLGANIFPGLMNSSQPHCLEALLFALPKTWGFVLLEPLAARGAGDREAD